MAKDPTAITGVQLDSLKVPAIIDAAISKKGKVIITADHGNIEQLIDYDTGMPHTAHTMNLVPVILIDEERKKWNE